MQLSQREAHHQLPADRRGLFAQAHNLLRVTAARRILVAWKARRLHEPAYEGNRCRRPRPLLTRGCAARACPA
jgi:hypothetical protein